MREGKFTGTIVKHELLENAKGTPYLRLFVEIAGEGTINADVFLSDKALDIARRVLKICGFDFRTQALLILDENKTFLAGRTVPVEIATEEYGGRSFLKAQIVSAPTLDKTKVNSIEGKLRAQAPDDEDEIPF